PPNRCCRWCARRMRPRSRGRPITWATGTYRSRSATVGSRTSTTTFSTRWSRSWDSSSRPAPRPSNPKPAVTGTANATGSIAMSTDMNTSTDTNTDREHLDAPATDVVAVSGVALTRLLQLVSPALPIGAFAYSQGLEQAVASGWVTDEATAAEWLLGLLHHGVGTLDLPVLERLIDAWRTDNLARVDAWSAWLAACRPTRETRAEERQLGSALARALGAIGVRDAAGWEACAHVTQAAMFALGAARFAIPTSAALAGYAFAWAEATTSEAVRLVPLGQSAGQRLLAAAGDEIPDSVARARALADDELASTTPGQAIASALHEALYSRLFRS